MKSKAPLALMEQMIMLLVFALAAALCLQAFVKSDQMSKAGEDRDRAAVLCQSAAEAIRYCGGDGGHALAGAAELLGARYEQGMLVLDYDGDWEPLTESGGAGVYRLAAQGVPTDVPGLGKAWVGIVAGDQAGQEPEVIFELEVAWQEVSAHG